ncbi:CD206 [Mytilus edulis]|uniref:MRC n=1 Tax=Mytilus edulis TaxID=6550 RepID=A0A8S3UXK9_MYTED|nr:CD206 [Mytilus edulis]
MVALALFTFIIGLGAVIPDCDKGWALFQGECLYFSRTAKVWLDAEADCRRHQAYLATDDNQAKHNFIADFLNVFTSWGLNHFWLGASDYTFENRWQWLETGGVVSGFSAWLPGYPNGNLSQNCMMTVFNGSQLYWDDQRCDSHHGHRTAGLHYICEKPDPDYNAGSIIGISLTSATCPKGWAEFDGECLYFNKTPKTWVDAETSCRHMHSYLATDDNPKKHEFIKEILNILTASILLSTACDLGWTSYKGKCIYFSNKQLYWNEAEVSISIKMYNKYVLYNKYCKAACEKKGAYLVTIDSEDKMNFVSKYLNVFQSFRFTHFWIGLKDAPIEGQWRWIETGSSLGSYSSWGPGQPDGDTSQNCV